MDPILTLEHVTKQFSVPGAAPVLAVRDVSFSVCPGEAVGIIGASGSGKSTLAKLITRLEDTASGTIRFRGQDITHARGKILRDMYHHMQMVFQMPVTTFDPRRTLGDGIGESLRNQGLPAAAVRERVAALLVQCGLDASFAEKYPQDVSGGQCQRASLARALAVMPELLICDEATSSLDVLAQAQIMQLLMRLQREQHMAVLFITHNIALTQGFCRRLLVMRDGAIIEQGLTDCVISHPQQAYTRQLIDAVI